MSASQWDRLLAPASGLLTNEDCDKLLDFDIFSDDDLLKSLQTPPKVESSHYALQDDLSNSLYPPSPPETKPSRAELANDILQQLDNQCKQENIFSHWLEEKVELPIFENISQVPERVEVPAPLPPTLPPPILSSYGQHPPTEELLREFETVYDAVELTHLTPPQSPPGPATQLLLSYAQQAQCAPLAPALSLPQQPHPTWPITSAPVPVPLPVEYDADLQSVEELVRHRAAQLPSPLPYLDSASASPRSSPPSSPRSSSTDEEWSGPSRSKPYSRPSEDRRSRKKEQNKNAATRYRQKKKAEIEVLLSEENALRQRHTDLGEKCSDLQREIRYIKGLMRDLFKAKGLIK